MDILSTEEVRVDEIRIDKDFDKLKDDAHVRQLADSISRVGLLHEPLVNMDTMTIVEGQGRKRLAAHMLLERPTIRVKLCKFTHRGEEKLIAKEAQKPLGKSRRSPSKVIQDELLATYLSDRNSVAALPVSVAPGAVTEARQGIAKKLGIEVEDVARAARRARNPQKPRKKTLKPKEDVLTHGIILPDDWLLSDIRDARQRVNRVRRQALIMKQWVGQLRDAEIGDQRFKNIEELADELFQYAEGAEVLGLCPYCKGLPEVRRSCGNCAGTAKYFASQVLNVPEELLDVTRRLVMVDGKLKKYDDYAEVLPGRGESGGALERLREGDGEDS